MDNDAPFRETAKAIAAARIKGALAVEMEPLRSTRSLGNVTVLCLAHVTNTIGLADRDFEKVEVDGTADTLMILETLSKVLHLICKTAVRLPSDSLGFTEKPLPFLREG